MKHRYTHWVLCLLLTAGLLGGCGLLTKEPPAVASVTLTDKVDPRTRAAANAVTAFPKGTKVMYTSVQVLRPQKGTKVEAHWHYDQEGKGSFGLVDAAEVVFDTASQDRHVAFSLEATTTFPAGAYKVQVFLDGKAVKELAFSVKAE